ncbi:MAG: HD domain-containing protein [Patescibacteria group bacterium]|nr:HD domain-containing protein [Patescibacteria group bacterium]MDD5294329.1 HD domain-containing protein [Patescibacteria group bacterium]MDD5554152.1 HD domain-containing protein [Patescibacteria group bacterium]
MKNYNYKKIRQKVKKLVKDACYSAHNHFSYTDWPYHILPVVDHSLYLGRKLKADLEVLELAAYLHDYAGILDYRLYKKHHLHGARLAGKILAELGFSKEKIKKVQECIISHRGSIRLEHKSKEARILASADAMSHITEFFDMCYLTFNIHKYETLEGAKWLKAKLERSWRKTMPAGKKLIEADYEQGLKIINKAILRKL